MRYLFTLHTLTQSYVSRAKKKKKVFHDYVNSLRFASLVLRSVHGSFVNLPVWSSEVFREDTASDVNRYGEK
jgi:hypothetical protein